MRYKVTLTTDTGEVISQWNLCMTNSAEIADEFNLSRRPAAQCFLSEVIEEMERADVRALKG
ncbi:MAG: hypothetical protein ABI806_24805 [Candidatus Solibacter sp.]